ncbi:helix-turn-helix transcriptional regulator [Streptomyces specialis]|uniref:helix-turn-helix transcriptional regulator n=1 Tax=Streptomyces specialis TaxID=498367 RepID=UPI001F316C8F|nr:helix-turn-helix transcriptional regulator [Streptomyces specialis]
MGSRLRAERLHANLTQEALAHLAGVERTSIIRIELGHSSPRLDRLLRVAHVLGIDPARLMPGGPRPGGSSQPGPEEPGPGAV